MRFCVIGLQELQQTQDDSFGQKGTSTPGDIELRLAQILGGYILCCVLAVTLKQSLQ